MRLQDLAAGLTAGPATGAAEITGLTADSRAVRPGFLFVAVRGAKADGAAFVADAVKRGAAAILTEPDVAVAADVPVLRAADPRHALAMMAARLHPRQPQKLVAVTGTSGKTSVAWFTRQIFAAAGHKAASIGTLGVVTDAGIEKGSLTTPDPVELHATLDRLAREGFTHAVLEASSHGLDQRRLDGLRLTAAGFTNLGRDHLDYHPTVADYLKAKLRLFEDVLPAGEVAVIDADGDVSGQVIAAAARAGRKPMPVGFNGTNLRIASIMADRLTQAMRLEVYGRRMDVQLPLAGLFQASNAVVAVGLAIAAGVMPEIAVKALNGLKGAPGRLEKVADGPGGGAVFVDYAHKPDAVKAVLATLRPLTKGRLIVVLGAGGDRDRGKRPLMGAVAAGMADVVIVTDDNPRSEDPATIRAAIMAAAPGAIEIAARGEAIAAAVAMMRPGDVVCIAGKGHETGQIVGDRVLPFSDHEAVAGALRRAAS